uniref:IgGFc_binding domain-containing protein n=1 Tax=Haemonchus contortus TaxID=6289 RepID=A0A7I5E9B2_HAECO
MCTGSLSKTMVLRLLLPFLLAIDVAAEPSIGIRHGRISDLPRHLQLAKMNAVPLSAAATTIAQGTSFVYSYLNSHLNAKDTSYTENLALSITNPTDQIASVTITSSYANFTTINTIVGGGEVKTVAITPADIQTDYMDQYLQYAVIETKVLFVDSNVTISLIASNSLTAGGGEDKFVVLPICQLGLEYHVVGDESSHVFQSYQSTNIITIIATQDQTTVQMNYLYTAPTVLNRGEQLTIATYYTQTTVAVTSDKPVAVISGSVCGYGYYNPSHCSYEVLMLAPSSNWAKDAAYYKFQPEDIGEFMVLFEKENTVVYIDEVQVDGGPFGHDSYLIVGTRTGSYVRANGPIYVVAVGSSNSQNQGAPFFANVPSSSSFSQGPFIFSVAPTLDEQLNLQHFIRVICSSLECIGTVKVDNYVPNGLLFTRMGRSNSYFVDVAVKGGKHTVSFVGADTPWAPITFGVTVYGYGLNRGYAFTPGLSYQANGIC